MGGVLASRGDLGAFTRVDSIVRTLMHEGYQMSIREGELQMGGVIQHGVSEWLGREDG